MTTSDDAATREAGVDIRSVLLVGCAEGKVETALAVDDVARARNALGLE
jgi:hypothetical protein